MVLKEKGVIDLARLILNLAKKTGIDNALLIIESSPGVFMDLTSNQHLISENLENVEDSQKVVSLWTKENTEENIEKLRLTTYQAILLFAIIKHNNSATLEDLIVEFEKKDISVGTGSMIGGSLAGISKKCVSYGIPKVFKIIKGKENLDTYKLIPTEEDTVKVFKKCLKPLVY